MVRLAPTSGRGDDKKVVVDKTACAVGMALALLITDLVKGREGRHTACHGAGEIPPKAGDGSKTEFRSVEKPEKTDDSIRKTISKKNAIPLNGEATIL